MTEDAPSSARLPPDEDRENIGWLGRPSARDCLDPDIDRIWLPPKLEPAFPLIEFDLFIAEDGCGIAELGLMPPRV